MIRPKGLAAAALLATMFLVTMLLVTMLLATVVTAQDAGSQQAAHDKRPNILLITADDLNYDSVGVYGSKVKSITPNIDALARQGMRFLHGHVTIAVCQPSRSVLMTGRYPHRNGARGFEPIRKDIPTLTGLLRKAGYVNGILGKTRHLAPAHRFAWDFHVERRQLGEGRAPKRYYQEVVRFLQLAKKRKRPFFLMANSHDPHRPFAGSQQEKRIAKRRKIEFPPASRVYKPAAVEVPGFLPDIPQVRKEIAQYFTSVHRCDQTVGQILRALRESGLEKNTLVLFISDNGMALPFAKTNVYLASTKVPWIVRWPGRVAAGSVDKRHFVSGIDFMATALEAAAVRVPAGLDGRSFLPVLQGKEQDGRDHVLTVFHQTSARRNYPMRCLQNHRFGYIRNAWSDGRTVFKNESQNGLSFRAMRRAAAADPAIAARVKLFQYRVTEELYDFAQDPDARRNLAHDPAYKDVVLKMRKQLEDILKQNGDPDRELFLK
ncbi:MAG: sulfatase family protein [Planctomycetota bacterium]|jgi:N-sulfoglucosamine sulfohydrolase